MSGPYLLPETPEGAKVPLDVGSFDAAIVGVEARGLLKERSPECHQALQTAFCAKRSFEEIRAAECFCAAVVQQKDTLERFPTFTDYMEEVCPKRQAVEEAVSAAEGATDGDKEKE